MEDRWAQLWKIATSEPEGDAIIVPHSDNPDAVLLKWPGGSTAGYVWEHGRWVFLEQLCTCPADVAARDTF